MDEFDDRLMPFCDAQGSEFFSLSEAHMDALKNGSHIELTAKLCSSSVILYYDRSQMRLDKEKILEMLKNNIEMFKNTYHVLSMGLFGSYARDEATPESDIDIYVMLDDDGKKLHCWTSLLDLLENNFNKKIDLCIGHSRMRPGLQASINEEIIWVF